MSSQHSFSSVESHQFVKLNHICNPQLKVPSRATFGRIVLGRVDDKKIEIKRKLDDRQCKISMIAYSSSSRIYRGYIVITGH